MGFWLKTLRKAMQQHCPRSQSPNSAEHFKDSKTESPPKNRTRKKRITSTTQRRCHSNNFNSLARVTRPSRVPHSVAPGSPAFGQPRQCGHDLLRSRIPCFGLPSGAIGLLPHWSQDPSLPLPQDPRLARRSIPSEAIQSWQATKFRDLTVTKIQTAVGSLDRQFANQTPRCGLDPRQIYQR